MEQSKSCLKLKNLNNFNSGTTFCTFMYPIPIITPKQYSCILWDTFAAAVKHSFYFNIEWSPFLICGALLRKSACYI